MRKSPYEILQDRAGEWRFHVKGANGEIVAQSEGYTTRRGCERGLAALQRIVVEDTCR